MVIAGLSTELVDRCTTCVCHNIHPRQSSEPMRRCWLMYRSSCICIVIAHGAFHVTAMRYICVTGDSLHSASSMWKYNSAHLSAVTKSYDGEKEYIHQIMLHGSETWPVRKENKKPSCRWETARAHCRLKSGKILQNVRRIALEKACYRKMTFKVTNTGVIR